MDTSRIRGSSPRGNALDAALISIDTREVAAERRNVNFFFVDVVVGVVEAVLVSIDTREVAIGRRNVDVDEFGDGVGNLPERRPWISSPASSNSSSLGTRAPDDIGLDDILFCLKIK